MLTIPSYNDGEFDPSVPSGEPETPEPPPIEEDLQLESRTPGSEQAVGDAARQRGTPAARSKRAAEKAAAASPESTSHPAAATPAAAPAAASRGSPRPAEPPTTPMETDEPHAAPPPTAATADEGGAEGVAPSHAAVPDEDVTESDLFREDDEEGGGALSSPPTRALAPNLWPPT